MTDIFSNASQFVVWSFIYASMKFSWSLPVRLVIFVPLCALMFWQFFSPLEIVIQSSIGRPINIALSLATIGAVLLFLIGTVRNSAGHEANGKGS